jgi:Outer membrane receptor proteins, mostly Fe transport
MKKRFVLLALLLCKFVTLFSQFVISGTVKDVNGDGLNGATVFIQEISKGAITNPDGEFQLKISKPGDYTINASFLGYETVSKTITANTNATISFTLVQKSFLSDEVVVTATRANGNMPVTSSTVTKDEISKQNLGQDMPYLLSQTPSIVTTSDAGAGIGYTNFKIRGTDVNRINVTVNGIPINDAESHGVWWVDLPDISSSVENVQIQRGVGTSTLGGGAFGATINLQTTSLNKNPYAEITSSYGSFNSFKNSVSFGSGLINNHFTFDARLSKISSDGYIDRASSDLKSLYLSGSYHSSKTLLKLVLSSGTEKTYQAWDGVSSDSLKTNRTYNDLGKYTDAQGKLVYYNNQTDNYQLSHYQLIFSHSLSSNLNVNAALHYSPGKGYYEEYKEGQPFKEYALHDHSGDTTHTNLIRRKWLDNAFYGVTWSLNYTKNGLNLILGGGANQYFGKHYGRVMWAQYFGDGQIDHQYYYSSGTKNDINIFAKSTYAFNNRITVFGDVQYRYLKHSINGVDDDVADDGTTRDITQTRTFKFFNPKAGLTFTVDKMNSLYAYVGIAHREPTRDDLVATTSQDIEPKPERLLDYELGYNLTVNNIKFTANFYYMDYKDQLVQTGQLNDVGTAITTNVNKSYRSGIELIGSINILKELTWEGNLTLSRNIIKNFNAYLPVYDSVTYMTVVRTDIEKFNSTQISFSPNIIAGSRLSFSPAQFITLSLVSKYVNKQYLDNTQSENQTIKSYFINDLRINCKFKTKCISSIEPIFMLNNIFNTKYETNAWDYLYKVENMKETLADKAFYPQAGRNIMIGLIIKF